jgi:hypothetical protein
LSDQNADSSNPFNEQDMYGLKTQTYIDQKIFFSLFKLVSYNTFFILKNDNFKECIEKLHEFNNIDYFIKLLGSNYISLDKMTNMLNYLYAMYFLDVVGDSQTNQNLINTEELTNYCIYKEYLELVETFKDCETNQTEKVEDLLKNITQEDYKYIKYKTLTENYKESFAGLTELMKDVSYIEAKYNFTAKFMKVIDVYDQEIENMCYWIYFTKNDIKDIEGYVKTLMDLIRYISGFFWDVYKKTNIYNQVVKKYYKLGVAFINNIENIKKIIEVLTDSSSSVRSIARSIILNPKLSSEEIQFVRNPL